MRLSKNNKNIALYLVLMVLIPLLAWSINTLLEGYRVSSTPTKIVAYNTCKSINSTDGNDYFVPTRTQTEWDTFLGNTPPALNVEDCPIGTGCKLRYRIKSDVATSSWAETPWGDSANPQWMEGPVATTTGAKNTIAFEVGVMCQPDLSFDLGYRYRGNAGPYWNTTIGSHYADVIVSSGVDTWGASQFTIPFTKSCNVVGGDGTCGFLIYEMNEVGTVKCDTSLTYVELNDTTPGYLADKYGASTGQGNCPTEGCGIKMAIRCYDPSTFSCSDPNTILANGASPYTVADCQTAGGVVYDTGAGCGCKFTASACPAGWTPYDNWSTTVSNTCGFATGDTCYSSCTTGSHAWSNTAKESCIYYTGNAGGDGSFWCNSSYCYANITEIGCK